MREHVNSLYISGKKAAEIKRFLEKKNLKITHSMISRHVHKHIPPPNILAFASDTKKQSEDLSKKQLMSLTNFLDLIITNVEEKIKTNKLNPTVQDAVKAAEIKSKIKGQSDKEKALLDFFLDVSSRCGNIS